MDSQEANKRFKLADQLYRSKQYSEALYYLDELDSHFPDDRHIMYPRARCLAMLGRDSEAISLCDDIVSRFQYEKAVRLRDRLSAKREEPGETADEEVFFFDSKFDEDEPSDFEADPVPAAPVPPGPQTDFASLGDSVPGAPARGSVSADLASLGDSGPIAGMDNMFNVDTPADGGAFAAPAIDTSSRNFPTAIVAVVLLLSLLAVAGLVYTFAGSGAPEGDEIAETAEEGMLAAEGSGNAGSQVATALGSIVAFIVFAVGFLLVISVASLYFGLSLREKLPTDTVSGNLRSVVLITIGLNLVSLVPFIGPFLAIYILHKVYDLGFMDFLVLVLVSMGLSVVYSVVVFGAFLLLVGTLPDATQFDSPDGLVEFNVTTSTSTAPMLLTKETDIPHVDIVADGDPSEWASIPTMMSSDSGGLGFSSYGLLSVKVARNFTSMFFLFDLTNSVDEMADIDVAEKGFVVTREIGKFTFESEEYRITFDFMSWRAGLEDNDPDPSTWTEVDVRCEVTATHVKTFRDIGTFKVDEYDYPGYIVFDGTIIEAEIPVYDMDISPPAHAKVMLRLIP